MKSRVTLEAALVFTKYGVNPISCWPPPIGTTGFAVLWYNFLVWFGITHIVTCGVLYFCEVVMTADDKIKIIKMLSQISSLISVTAKIIICRIERPRLEILIRGVEDFLAEATRAEKDVIQAYVDKCLIPHVIALLSAIFGPMAFMITPFVTSEILPVELSFFLPVHLFWAWLIAYIWQCAAIVQVGSLVFVDTLYAILLWYTSARFHILAQDFREATNLEDITRCVRKHQNLLSYVKELQASTRLIAVEVIIVTIGTIITGGVVLIEHPTLIDLVRYIFYEIASFTELLLLIWPADHLIEKSLEIGTAAYSSDWVGKSPAMMKDILIVIRRSQEPITIAMDGVIPPLSLEFYRSTIAATLSYFTTLRALTAD